MSTEYVKNDLLHLYCTIVPNIDLHSKILKRNYLKLHTYKYICIKNKTDTVFSGFF